MNIKLIERKVKKLTLKHKPNGEFVLTVPKGYPKDEIVKFIDMNKEWMEKVSLKTDYSLIWPEKEGDTFYVFGKPYKVVLKYGSLEPLILGDEIIFYLKDINNELDFKKKLHKYIYQKLEDRVTPLVYYYLHIMNETINKLSYKHLTAANGNCYFTRREINLSDTLIGKKQEFIEAIIVHEIAHLKHHNHSKDFYNEIYKIMPDYKLRIKGK